MQINKEHQNRGTEVASALVQAVTFPQGRQHFALIPFQFKKLFVKCS